MTKKEECPKCDELMFVFMRTIPIVGAVGDIDLYECRACGCEEAQIVLATEWGIRKENKARIDEALKVAVEKHEPGMLNTRKTPGEFPICDAIHEFDTGLEEISP